jgi:hypothetical protein
MLTDHLAVGLVILISMAISLGVVFVLVLIGILVALRHRNQSQNNTAYPVGVHADNNDEQEKSRHRPTSLLATLNAATAMMTEKEQRGPNSSASSFVLGDPGASSSHVHDGDAAGAAAVLAGASGSHDHDDDEGVEHEYETHARYSFDAEREGELSLRTNDPVLVLDSHSDSQWCVSNTQLGLAC